MTNILAKGTRTNCAMLLFALLLHLLAPILEATYVNTQKDSTRPSKISTTRRTTTTNHLPFQSTPFYKRQGDQDRISFPFFATREGDEQSCPFTKPFRRYQIPLSSGDPKSSAKSKPFLPFLKDFQRSSLRKKLEQQKQNSSTLRWKEGMTDGVQLFSFLYAAAVEVAQQQQDSELLVALPDAPLIVVRQWVDIMDWMVQTLPRLRDTSGKNYAFELVQAEFSCPENVPCVSLRRLSNPSLPSPQLPITIDIDPDLIHQRTQSWVKRVLVELGICPFTKSVKLSGQGLADVGVPIARIAYHTSAARTTLPLLLLRDTWITTLDMMQAGPSGKMGISSILLAAPAFDEDFDFWAGPIFAMLEAGVVAARAEDRVGVVCFHPKYVTPDGSTFPGFGHMHSLPRLEQWMNEGYEQMEKELLKQKAAAARKNGGRGGGEEVATTPSSSSNTDNRLSTCEIAAGGAWQRRTPHATINVLRADQLAAAEGRRNTPQLYRENVMKLVTGVGLEELQQALDQERSLK